MFDWVYSRKRKQHNSSSNNNKNSTTFVPLSVCCWKMVTFEIIYFAGIYAIYETKDSTETWLLKTDLIQHVQFRPHAKREQMGQWSLGSHFDRDNLSMYFAFFLHVRSLTEDLVIYDSHSKEVTWRRAGLVGVSVPPGTLHPASPPKITQRSP